MKTPPKPSRNALPANPSHIRRHEAPRARRARAPRFKLSNHRAPTHRPRTHLYFSSADLKSITYDAKHYACQPPHPSRIARASHRAERRQTARDSPRHSNHALLKSPSPSTASHRAGERIARRTCTQTSRAIFSARMCATAPGVTDIVARVESDDVARERCGDSLNCHRPF